MSVNGTKGTTVQWDLNDEITGCGGREGAFPTKTSTRDITFCDNVTIQGNLVVAGNVSIQGTLTVGGTVTAPFFDGLAARAVVASSLG